MQVEALGYRPWTGRLLPACCRFWPITRVGWRLLLRRRTFWFFLILGLLNFVLHFALIYFLAHLEAEVAQRGQRLPRFVNEAIFTGNGKSYRDFIALQSTVVMLLLAFAGSLLVGNDFRFRAIGFYLSRPIGKLTYFFGKLAAVFGLTALITLLPALVLFFEYGAFGDSLAYFRESQRIFWAILGYGGLVSLFSGVLILGVAALFQRTISVAAVWGGLFIFMPMVGEGFRALGRDGGADPWQWALLDFWALLRWTGSSFFGIKEEIYLERLPLALLVLGGWTALSLWVFWRRVRAVEVLK